MPSLERWASSVRACFDNTLTDANAPRAATVAPRGRRSIRTVACPGVRCSEDGPLVEIVRI
jgi:hypothetical protein